MPLFWLVQVVLHLEHLTWLSSPNIPEASEEPSETLYMFGLTPCRAHGAFRLDRLESWGMSPVALRSCKRNPPDPPVGYSSEPTF